MFNKKKEKPVKRKKSTLQDWIEALIWCFVVAFVIKNFTFGSMYKIPSSSMEQTLLIGDFLVGNKITYFFSEPKREDIVIFDYPDDPAHPQPRERFARLMGTLYWDKESNFLKWHQKKNVVKRIIGMPGDTVEIRNKRVLLNGEIFERGYEQYIDRAGLANQKIQWDSSLKANDSYFGEYDGLAMGNRDNFREVVVPEGYYFVLGDNRDVSADSRMWGFLSREAITGKPFMTTISHGEPPITNIRDYYSKEQGILRTESGFRSERFFRSIK